MSSDTSDRPHKNTVIAGLVANIEGCHPEIQTYYEMLKRSTDQEQSPPPEGP